MFDRHFEIVRQVDTVFASGTLSQEDVNALLNVLERYSISQVSGVSKDRWGSLLQHQENRVRFAWIRRLLDNGSVQDANEWLNKSGNGRNLPEYLLLTAQFCAMSGEYDTALSLSLEAFFYSRDPAAEAAAMAYYEEIRKGDISYSNYRDEYLQTFAAYYLSSKVESSPENPKLDKREVKQLFADTATRHAGIVAFWDEYLTFQEKEYLAEAYSAAQAMGLPFKLCYAGSDPERAKLNLPSGLPVAGIEFKREMKAAARMKPTRLPTLLVVERDGSILFREEGVNRSFVTLLHRLLNEPHSSKD